MWHIRLAELKPHNRSSELPLLSLPCSQERDQKVLAERGHRSACEQRAHYETELTKLHNQLRQKDKEYEALETEMQCRDEALRKEAVERAKLKQDAAAQAAQHGLAMRKRITITRTCSSGLDEQMLNINITL